MGKAVPSIYSSVVINKKTWNWVLKLVTRASNHCSLSLVSLEMINSRKRNILVHTSQFRLHLNPCSN